MSCWLKVNFTPFEKKSAYFNKNKPQDVPSVCKGTSSEKEENVRFELDIKCLFVCNRSGAILCLNRPQTGGLNQFPKELVSYTISMISNCLS